jgi:hypothetical protein
MIGRSSESAKITEGGSRRSVGGGRSYCQTQDNRRHHLLIDEDLGVGHT